MTNPHASAQAGSRLILIGVTINAFLAIVKVVGGIWGQSNALLADGLESALDILSSALIWGALRYSGKPPDEQHPYGHGKIESLTAFVSAIFLIGAGISVAFHSFQEIASGIHTADPSKDFPKTWTLLVLVGVILTKELLFRAMLRTGEALGSSAIRADAWHHRSDALTSLAAFLGISTALVGGPSWAVADDWAALFSVGVILWNGLRMLRSAVGEVMDEQVSNNVVEQIKTIADEVPGVSSIEKCRVRRSGMHLLADVHVRVHGSLTVWEGHHIGHEVQRALLKAQLRIIDVNVHIEPEPD